jgi:hypothetical protein
MVTKIWKTSTKTSFIAPQLEFLGKGRIKNNARQKIIIEK